MSNLSPNSRRAFRRRRKPAQTSSLGTLLPVLVFIGFIVLIMIGKLLGLI